MEERKENPPFHTYDVAFKNFFCIFCMCDMPKIVLRELSVLFSLFIIEDGTTITTTVTIFRCHNFSISFDLFFGRSLYFLGCSIFRRDIMVTPYAHINY